MIVHKNIELTEGWMQGKELLEVWTAGEKIWPTINKEKQITGNFSIAPLDNATAQQVSYLHLALYRARMQFAYDYSNSGVMDSIVLTHRGKKYNLLYTNSNSVKPDAIVTSDGDQIYKNLSASDFGYVEEDDEVELTVSIGSFTFIPVPATYASGNYTVTTRIACPLIDPTVRVNHYAYNQNTSTYTGNCSTVVKSYPAKTSVLSKSSNNELVYTKLNTVSGSTGHIITASIPTSNITSASSAPQIYMITGAVSNNNVSFKKMSFTVKGKVIKPRTDKVTA